jgi:signal transduction histidine kinase
MLRHDLYDVDRALAGAVTYGAVTAVLLGVYTAMSFAAGIVLGPKSTVAAAGATAACALALAPLRMRLQRRVDRRLYPLRQAALSAIDGLRERTHAGEAQPEELEEVLRSALRDPALRVGYLVPGVGGAIDAAGARTNPVGSVVPVTQGGVQIGLLLPGVGAASRELLRQVAAASAMLVEVVRLRLQLSGALREVEASRARLVQVGDHERRRLERDLHDGAQQRLVSLGMALRLAQRHIHDGAVDVDGLLDQSVAELGTAVAELRQIAHGLRPSTLDGGLGAALIALTQSVPMTVDLDVPDDQLPDAVATTAYYVASEALTNAVKHAEARRLGVWVVRSNGVVRVRISDDGRGGTTLRAGSGLAGLNDRVAALGGSLTVASPAGRGTVVEAVLPCGS